MGIGIGIDTGGTYTDGVIYDFDNKIILAKAKALTTKEDLSIGISNVLNELPEELLIHSEIVSLSTTLATNACVEGKGGRGKLLFIGADKDVVIRTGKDYGLPESNEIYFLDGEINYTGDVVKEPNWDELLINIKEWIEDADALAIVQQLGIRNSSSERKTKELLNEQYRINAVCGYELFNDLNYIKRGSSTLLNARLMPVIDGFLKGIKDSLEKRNIKVPVVIVRSDGTLMSEEFTTVRPVETLLCGPAASVIGGMELSKEKNALLVDMGGTTTDMAMIKDGIPEKTQGVKIGKWKTFVKSVYIDTFGLGGDSYLRCNKERELLLGTSRVLPICIAANRWPQIIKKLKKLIISGYRSDEPYYEFFYIVNDNANMSKFSNEEASLYCALKDGPLSYEEASQAIGKSVYHYYIERLENEGIIMRCGLTPTDIMHIKNDFSTFNREASLLAGEYVAESMNTSIEELCERAYDLVKERLYFNVVRMLLENKYEDYNNQGIDSGIERIIYDSWLAYKMDNKDFLKISFDTPATLVGVGAPIHIFLPEVAKALGAKCVIPEYASVANAVGAVVGNISATAHIDIREDGVGGFVVFTKNKNVHSSKLEEAIGIAESSAMDEAREEVIKRGAQGDIAVYLEKQEEIPSYFKGRTITASALGKVIL